MPRRFTHAWSVHADQVIPWMETFGIKPLVLASSERLLVGIEEAFVEAPADVGQISMA